MGIVNFKYVYDFLKSFLILNIKKSLSIKMDTIYSDSPSHFLFAPFPSSAWLPVFFQQCHKQCHEQKMIPPL